MVMVGRSRGRGHVRIHPRGRRRGRSAAVRVLRRRASGRAGGTVIDGRDEAGGVDGGRRRAGEQLLMMELLVILGEHAIDDEFGTHCCPAMIRSLHGAHDRIVRNNKRLAPHTLYDRALKQAIRRRLNPIAENFLRVLLLYFFESFMTHVCSVYSPLCLIRRTRAVMAPLHGRQSEQVRTSANPGPVARHAASLVR